MGRMGGLFASHGFEGRGRGFILRNMELYFSIVRSSYIPYALLVARTTTRGCNSGYTTLVSCFPGTYFVASRVTRGVYSARSSRNIFTIYGVHDSRNTLRPNGGCVTLSRVRSPTGLNTVMEATRTLKVGNTLLRGYYSICGPGTLHTSVNNVLELPFVRDRGLTRSVGGCGSRNFSICTTIPSTSTRSVAGVRFRNSSVYIVKGRKGNISNRILTRYTPLAVGVLNETRDLGTSITNAVIV